MARPLREVNGEVRGSARDKFWTAEGWASKTMTAPALSARAQRPVRCHSAGGSATKYWGGIYIGCANGYMRCPLGNCDWTRRHGHGHACAHAHVCGHMVPRFLRGRQIDVNPWAQRGHPNGGGLLAVPQAVLHEWSGRHGRVPQSWA